jgi:hypothetical protein
MSSKPEQAAAPVVVAGVGVDGIRAAILEITMRPARGITGMSAAEKYTAISKAVLEWLHARGKFYYVADRPEFAGGLYFDAVRKILQRIQSDLFQAWLSDCLLINRSERAFVIIQSALETESLTSRSAGVEPEAYWAARPGACYMSSGPGKMVKVTAEGVAEVDNGTDEVLFCADAVMADWCVTEPVDPFEACSLFSSMSTTGGHGKLLFKLWAMSLPSNQRTKPPVVVTGPVGSGKTRCIKGIFELYGIPARIGNIAENGENDFWVSVDAGGLYCADNADVRTKWFVNTMELVSTGGQVEKRKLYSDSDMVFLKSKAWVAISSANPEFAAMPGLADRLLVVRLDRRTGDTADRVLSEEIAAARDAGLSFIAYALQDALADKAAAPKGLNKRHPDWADLAIRIGRAIGQGTEAERALAAAEADKALFNLENDNIGYSLLQLCRAGTVSGTLAEIKEKLGTVDSFVGEMSTKKISKRIEKLWPHLSELLAARKEVGHDNTNTYFFKHMGEDLGGCGGFETAFCQ